MAATHSSTQIKRIPKLCRHKATGQAVVRLSGKDHYCGPYGSVEAQARYDELIETWLRNNRQPLPVTRPAPDPTPCSVAGYAAVLTVDDVLLAYWRHAEQYYGGSAKALEKIRLAARPLRRLYGSAPAAEFGAKGLKAVRQELLGVQVRRYVSQDADGNTVREWFREYRLGGGREAGGGGPRPARGRSPRPGGPPAEFVHGWSAPGERLTRPALGVRDRGVGG